jgi:hypothetical protein
MGEKYIALGSVVRYSVIAGPETFWQCSFLPELLRNSTTFCYNSIVVTFVISIYANT